jgi:hypothetical protein
MSSQRAISAGEAENFQKIPELFEKSRKTTPIVETWKNQVKGQKS